MKFVTSCFMLIMLITVTKNEAFHFSFSPQAKTTTSENPPVKLSLLQQFQLDFLYQELNEFPDLFIHDWTNDSNVRLILKSAELAVQKSSPETQPIMQRRIIDLFAQVDIIISFNDQNMIMKTDDFTQKTIERFSHSAKHIKIKTTKHQPVTNQDTQQPALHKIHGAGRTLRRIKAESAKQDRQQHEDEINQIHEKEAIRQRAKNRHKDELDVKTASEQHISSIEYWRNRLAQQQSTVKSEQNNEAATEHFIPNNE